MQTTLRHTKKMLWLFVSPHSLKDKITRWKATNHSSWEVKMVSVDEVVLGIDQSGRMQVLDSRGQKQVLPDAVFSIIPNEYQASLLSVLQLLEDAGVFIINNSQAMTTSMNKWFTHTKLARHAVPSIDTICIPEIKALVSVDAKFSFPLVVKKLYGSRGQQVWLVENRYHLQQILEKYFVSEKNTEDIGLLLQKYMKASHGRDIRVITVGNKCVTAMSRQSTGFLANISEGGVGTKHFLTPEQKATALSASRAVGLHVAGVDLLFDGEQDTWVVSEVNNNPGLRIEDVTGVSVTLEILDWLTEVLEN